MESRLGQLLVESNILTEDQVRVVLEHQRRSTRPFGLLCEELFGISPRTIEEAWARQYAIRSRTIDPQIETFDERALDLVTRRQAWQFRVLPIRFDNGDLMMATTPQHLLRALRFAVNTLGVPAYFVMADPAKLGEELCRRYPLPGLTPACINDNGMDHLINCMMDRAAG
jgi:hypothetical protein